MNPTEIFDFISRGGVAGILGYILWKLFKGDLRLSREVTEKDEVISILQADKDRLIKERNSWQELTLRAVHVAERSTEIVGNGK